MGRPTRFIVRHGEQPVTAEVQPDGRVQVEGHASPFTVTAVGDGQYIVSNGTGRWRVWVAGPADNRAVFVDGVGATLDISSGDATAPRKSRRGHGDASSPMPATVIAVLVVPGQAVAAGDVLLTLEAMKMELPIRSPRAGTVGTIHCQAGELVQPGIVLVDIT